MVKKVRGYLKHYNDTVEGFTWTKTAEAILEKAQRARIALDKNKN